MHACTICFLFSNHKVQSYQYIFIIQVQQLAHRPHLSPRALYNCVVFLNQLQLSKDDKEANDSEEATKTRQSTSLPASLINTYFHLFEMTVKKDDASKKKKGSKQSKSLKGDSSSYQTSRLLSALLTGVNRAHPYLPKRDAAMEQHIDALYRISHTAPPAAATQALMLLLQLAVGSGDVDGQSKEDESVTMRKDRFYRALYSKLVDGEMFTGRQLTLFFNLLYKAMKYDTSTERISAFAKRLLNTVLHQSSSIICGSLFLLSEIIRSHPELQNEVAAAVSEVLFDPTKREPRAAFAGKVSLSKNLWELSLLAHHFHPSVTKFTAGSGGDIAYKGDPLKDFGLSPFLDKFAFRNPKSLDKLSKKLKRGESIAERKSGLSGNMALPMNDPSYLDGSKKISEEDSFFHQFFVERAKRDEIKGIVRGSSAADKDDSDLEDEALNATEADDMIDNFDGDTDSEEEAFVNQLAEKLMESAGNGQANFDDEDPDMDDWSDFDSDNDNDEKDDEDDGKLDDENESDAGSADGNEEDAFMDAASSDEDEGGDIFGAGDDNSDVDGEDELPFGLIGEDVSDDDLTSKRKTSHFMDADEYERLEEETGANSSNEKKRRRRN